MFTFGKTHVLLLVLLKEVCDIEIIISTSFILLTAEHVSNYVQRQKCRLYGTISDIKIREL